MNDRFLCKAKRIFNKEWTTGYYHNDTSMISNNGETKIKDYIMKKVVNPYDYNNQEIDPNTLCQCTGKKDNEGNLVFEGDMFWHDYEIGTIGVIYWDTDELCWAFNVVPNMTEGEFNPALNHPFETWYLWEYEEVPWIIKNKHDL